WVLVSCESSLTMDYADDDNSPTPDPVPSPPSPRYAELPEPTADREPKPAVTHEPSQKRATEPRIALELNPDTSDQVREPATKPVAKEITVGRGRKPCPLHCRWGYRSFFRHHLNWEEIPPNLPLPPPLINLFPASTPILLDPISPSAHPQRWARRCLEDPSTPPPASEAQTPPQSCDPAAPPWLPAPSPPAPPGSLVPPALPWSVIPLPPPRDSSFRHSSYVGLLLPSSSSFRISAYASVWRSHLLRLGPLDPRLRPGSPALRLGLHHHLLCRVALSPPWLLRRGTIMGAAWVPPSCLLPPSDPPWTLLSPPWLLHPSSPPWTLFTVLLPGVRPPPEPPLALTSCQPFA
ncbi:hypothetical protein M9458_033850, partial [Cirrhinus mrigala]